MILVRHGQSEFNAHFSVTRQDPGIRDPRLTEEGRRQARAAAEALGRLDIRHLMSSPYTRALETAEIIGEVLGLEVEVEPMVGERAAFSCDIGTAPADLARRWPSLRIQHLAEQWWPDIEEPEQALLARCSRFRETTDPLANRDHIAVVSHWGFIRGLTGMPVGNCFAVRYRRSADGEAAVEVVHPR